MPSVNSKILIQDFNPIRDKVVAVLGQGSVDRGYGQVTQSQPVSESSKISINDWTNLRFDIINAYKHIYGSNPVTAVVSEGNTIRYTTSFAPDTGQLDVPQFQYAQYADQIDADRFTVALGESGTSPFQSSSRDGTWVAECLCTITFNWTNATQARYWFNSGGRIKISASRTGGTNSPQNTNWTNLLSTAGVVDFGGAFPITGTTPDNGGNWYRTNFTLQPFFSISGTGDYASSQFSVAARCVDVVSNSQGTAAQGELRLRFLAQIRSEFNLSEFNIAEFALVSLAQDALDGVLTVSVGTSFAGPTSLVPGGQLFTVESPVVNIGNVVEVPLVYQISVSALSVNEGSSVTFEVLTPLVPNGTTLYWVIEAVSGNITASDFTGSQLSGSFTVNNITGIIVLGISADATTETGTVETFRLLIKTGPLATSQTVATSLAVTINDTSLNPTYAISASTTSVNEGASVTFTVTTTDVANGPLYWSTLTVSGAITASDFTDGLLMGSFSINNNSGSITRTITADATLEGPESFKLLIRTVSVSGPEQVRSSEVTINDTSVAPIYAISPSAASVNEGSFVTFNVNTVGVADGTPLYWTTNVVEGTINAGDFLDDTLTGSFVITGNSGTVTRTITADATTEGIERFTLSIRTGSISGTVRVTSSAVTINDTSLNAPLVIARFSSEGVSSVNGVQQSTIEFQIQGNPSPGSYNYSLVTVPAGLAGAINSTTGTLTLPGTNRASFGQQTPHAAFTATVTLSRAGYQSAVATVSVPQALAQLNIGFTVSYNYTFPNYTVIGGYSGAGTYSSAPQTKAWYVTITNNTGLANSAVSAQLNTGGLVLQGIQPPSAWTIQDWAKEPPTYGRQPWAVNNVFGNPVQGGGPVIFVFQAPHTSPTTITLTASAAGYAPYNQSRTVPANNLYSPYTTLRGLTQDTRYPLINADLGRAALLEQYYNSNNQYAISPGIITGNPPFARGLMRSADTGGVEFWLGWSNSTGNAVGSQAFNNGFFYAVFANDYEWRGRADTSLKGFSPGIGWNRFWIDPE